jgi:hypothetical protein
MKPFLRKFNGILVSLVLICFSGMAQDTPSAEELANKLSNPIANLISMPLQNNSDFGIGSNGGSRNTLNIQPVIPFKLNENLNLITRWVFPFISQYNTTGEGESQAGFADAVLSAFLSPVKPVGGMIVGAGPVFLAPIASNDAFATRKTGLGPTAVILRQSKGFTFGALMNQIWSVAGDEDMPDVNQFYALPFLSYNWKSGAGLGAAMDYTCYWDENTTVAFVNLTASAVSRIGKQTVQFAAGPRIQVAGNQNNQAEFGIRTAFVLLFPK